MSEALIEARNVSRILPGIVPVTLVQNVNLAIGPREFIAVTGPSGSGKSSLMYLLGLLDLPTEGDVFIRGRSTSDMTEEERARTRLVELGFVFQFHFLLAEFTLTDNVAMPMRALRALSPAQIRERAEGLLDSLGLADHRHKRPDQISGGQRQRVAVARSLANEPAVILADEPTGNLDTKSSDQVFAILRDLVDQRGTTVVAVTHSEELASRMDRHIHLVDGRIVSDTVARRVPAE
jgi:lipoprotein-releasing system ATP-binding protein